MPDTFVELHRRINALERQTAGLSRRAKAHGWTLPTVLDIHRFGGGRLVWAFDGHSIHSYAHDSIWTENNIDATNYRTATYGGPNVEVNGVDEYLSIANAAWQETGSQTFLVWGWVYPTALHITQTIVAKFVWSTNNRSWVLTYDSTAADFVFLCNDTGAVATSTVVASTHGNVAVNGWYFVAGYFEPNTLMRIYVARNDDSRLTIDSLTSGVPANTFDGTAALTIGADGNPSRYFFGRLGRMMGRANLPGLTIDDHVAMLWARTRSFYQEDEPFLLRALFTAADQGYANAQVVDTAIEGIFDGQLTVVEVDGTLALTSQECVFTAQGTPVWGDLGFYSQAITRVLGRTVLGVLLKNATNTFAPTLGWHNAQGVDPDGADEEHLFYFRNDANIYPEADSTADEFTIIGAYAAATEYQLAIVLGGYDVSGVPWHSGEAANDYLYGASFYIKGGAWTAWTLLWRTGRDNTSTLYAAFANYTGTGTVDDFRAPDVDLKAVLKPLVKDTFTDTNGVGLDAHDPEVDAEGGGWVEQNGTWDIQGNRANATGGAPGGPEWVATIDTGASDVLIRAYIDPDAGSGTGGGIIVRYLDDDNLWMCRWETTADEVQIRERVGGGWNLRAATALIGVPGTAYDLVVIADGQDITAWVDGGSRVTWGAAALNETGTKHGLRAAVADDLFDNFHVHALRAPDYEHEFGAV